MSRWRKRAWDMLNAMLAAAGFNLVKLMRGLKRLFCACERRPKDLRRFSPNSSGWSWLQACLNWRLCAAAAKSQIGVLHDRLEGCPT